ncbi:MAG: segregation/condensation protein A [Candidatus Pacebacteria bacterium]|nr:segregation/condensation protein A [Candidatus Paceibacterota bacterium]
MSVFTIATENFEGPIDALLGLIEKKKLPINDISLVEIADDYINFVAKIDDVTLAERTRFIFVASTLTLIKSKSLLPTLDLTDDEEGDIEELKRRLEQLKAYQDCGQHMKKYMRNTPAWFYSKPRKKEISFKPHEDLTINVLLESIHSVFNEVPEAPKLKKEGSVTIAVHIEEMMDSLEKRIKQVIETDFHSFLGDHVHADMPTKQVRVYKVVGFLAMLELVKNGALHVLQKKNFSNINIEHV